MENASLKRKVVNMNVFLHLERSVSYFCFQSVYLKHLSKTRFGLVLK